MYQTMNTDHTITSAHKKLAFSLVELSIVLVVLGLLTGTVLSARNMARAAAMRAVAKDQARFVSAIATFRDKYFALPGDMTNAQSFWGVAHATPASCVSTASTTTATCNGNGDGKINYPDWSTATGSNEATRLWQQLANAGLIEGTYSGISTATPPMYPVASNAPSSQVSLGIAYWMPWHYGTGNAWSTDWRFNGDYGNALTLYKGGSSSTGPYGFLKAEEAWNIDTKLDDGKPASGKVVVHNDTSGSWSNCTNAANSASLTANYALASTGLCGLIFVNQF